MLLKATLNLSNEGTIFHFDIETPTINSNAKFGVTTASFTSHQMVELKANMSGLGRLVSGMDTIIIFLDGILIAQA